MSNLVNARFWVYVNDTAVKITLKPGQTLRHYRAEQTEEGWQSYDVTWHSDGVHVHREWCSDGRDCDGRLSHYGEDSFCIEGYYNYRNHRKWTGDLENCFEECYPQWGDGYRRVYDEYAQRAGY